VAKNDHYTYDLVGAYLTSYAKDAVEIINHTKGDTYPILVFQGLSGITRATAIAMHYPNIGMLYIRKPGEKSVESNQIVSYYTSKPPGKVTPYLIDDLIETGKTAKRLIAGFAKTNLYKGENFIAIVSEGGCNYKFQVSGIQYTVTEHKAGSILKWKNGERGN
jgi:orotate phosphoribosyltransferase